MSYFFNEAARDEHLEHVAYYESCQAGLGARYLLAFDTAMQAVCEAPERYRIEFPPSIRKNMKSASSLSEKPPSVSRKSTSMKSKTDLAQLKSGKVKPTTEHPEADVQHIVRGMVRKGLKVQPAKASISLRVDQDVLEWFKEQGAGYQTRINAVLKAYKDASV